MTHKKEGLVTAALVKILPGQGFRNPISRQRKINLDFRNFLKVKSHDKPNAPAVCG
jgi:hypothetical protein